MDADDKTSSLTAPPPTPPPSRPHGRGSKAWSSLSRIIAVIKTLPPSPHPIPTPDLESKPFGRDVHRPGTDRPVDLPVSAARSAEEEEKEGSNAPSSVVIDIRSSAESSAAEEKESRKKDESGAGERSISPAESAAGECDPLAEEEEEEAAEGRKRRKGGGEGYLELLVEAVRHVSGELFDGITIEVEAAEPSATAAGSKRRRECHAPPLEAASAAAAAEFDEGSRVVVTEGSRRRRRSQTMPLRYRDSVLEPWVKLPTVHRPGRSGRSGTAR